MERIFLSNKKDKSGSTKATKFTVLLGFLRRIIIRNKFLFLVCSFFAFLTALINYNTGCLVSGFIKNDGINVTINSIRSSIVSSNENTIRKSDIIKEIEKTPEALEVNQFINELGNLDQMAKDPGVLMRNDVRKIFNEHFEIRQSDTAKFKFSINFIFFAWSKQLSLTSFIVSLIVFIVFVKGPCSIFHWYVTSYSCDRIENDLKLELFEILMGAKYEKSSDISAKMFTQFSSDIDNIARNIWTTPNRLIYVIISIFLNGYFQLSSSLFLVIIPLFATLFTVIYYLLKKSVNLGIEAKKRYEEDNQFIFERISNLEYIKSVSSEKFENKKMSDRLDTTFLRNRKSLLWTVLFKALPEYMLIPSIPLTFVWIVSFLKSLSLADTVIYFIAVNRLNNEVTKIFNSVLLLEDLYSDLSIVMNSVNSLEGSKENGNLGLSKLPFVNGDVIFENVNFSYPSRPENKVIEDFSFTFLKDKKYGIAGKNGIGKSTTTKILLKLYDIDSGNVLIGKQNLYLMETADIHKNTCRLNNRPSFFNMSIAENVFYPFVYNKKTDLKKLTYAAKQTKVSNFIKSLPAGFDTVLSAAGSDLSEGQKQQIEAMKVFVKDHSIYIFDEILSNVHPLTRKIILKNIFTSIKDKLVIAIDHHYDIFGYMDYVYAFSSKKLSFVKNYQKLTAVEKES